MRECRISMAVLEFPFPWHFLDLDNGFASIREELEDTIKQQRKQMEELERDKDELNSSLAQSRERISYLQQEVKITALILVMVFMWFLTTQMCQK